MMLLTFRVQLSNAGGVRDTDAKCLVDSRQPLSVHPSVRERRRRGEVYPKMYKQGVTGAPRHDHYYRPYWSTL